MIVQCDKCDAKFQLNDDKIGEKGAKVRCSKCKSVFTVHKPKAAAPAPPPPPKPPAKSKSQAPGKAGGGEDDPFSDFNFSDDLDFSEEPEAAAPPPKAAAPVAPEFDDSPGVSFEAPEPEPPPPPPPPPPPAKGKPKGGSGEDGFDFSDEDFSFSDDAAAPSAAAPPPKAAPPKGGGDFGNVSFGDDSFSAPDAPPASAPASSSAEWGNVSMEDVTDDAEIPQGAAEFDDVGFGDFKFDADDKLPGKGSDDDDSMDVIDDFVRSPSSKAKVSDDLEASIGDSEPEPERERRPEPREEEPSAPPPPKPAVRRESSGPSPIGKVLKVLAVLVVLALAAGGGAIAFFKIPIDAVTSFDVAKIQGAIDEWMYLNGKKERPLEGAPVIVSAEKTKIIRDDGSPALLVYGDVRNSTNKRLKEVKIVAQLEGADTNQLYAEYCYCHTNFDQMQLKSWSKETLESGMHASLRELPPVERDSTCKYMIVFVDLTEGVIFKSVEIQNFLPLPDVPQ